MGTHFIPDCTKCGREKIWMRTSGTDLREGRWICERCDA